VIGRRAWLAGFGSTAAAWPLVRAQRRAKVPRIGFLHLASVAAGSVFRDAVLQGLRELGYVEGRNLLLEIRTADGKLERLAQAAAELVRLEVDVIVAATTAATRAAQTQTRTVPILCFTLGDPVGAGLVASLARPGGNITGLSALSGELVPKCLSLLKEAVPRVSRVAVLWEPNPLTEKSGADMLRGAGEAARRLGVALQLVDARGAGDLDAAFATMTRERCDALLVLPSVLGYEERRRIADLALAHRLPSMSHRREEAEAGALMAYGASYKDLWRRGATYVDRILKGAKPADLPVEQPTRFELVINMKTANALGLAIPRAVLLRADEVIE